MLTKHLNLSREIEISIISPEPGSNLSASHLNNTNGIVPGLLDVQNPEAFLEIPGNDLQVIVDQDSRLGTSIALSRKEQRSRRLERKKQAKILGDKSFHSPDIDRTLLPNEDISMVPKIFLQETFYIELEEVGSNTQETQTDDSIPQIGIIRSLEEILDGVNGICIVGEIGGNASSNGDLSKIEIDHPHQRHTDPVLIYELELIEKHRKREIVTNIFAWILWVLFAASLGCATYYIMLVVIDITNNSTISEVEWSYFILFGLVGPIVTGSAAIMVCCRCGRKEPQNKDPRQEILVI
jgi:hypothetical protein